MGDIDAMAVGLAVWRLGAGRAVPGERVQSGAGLRIHRRPGEPVAAGEALFTLYTDTPERFEGAMAEMDGGWSVGDAAPAIGPLIIDRITTMTTPLTLDTIRQRAEGAAARPPRRRAATGHRARARPADRLRRTARRPTSTAWRRGSAPPRTADRSSATWSRSRTRSG